MSPRWLTLAFALFALPASAGSLALSPAPLVVQSASGEGNEVRGSLSLSSASLDTGELQFLLDAAVIGPNVAGLTESLEALLDFGSAQYFSFASKTVAGNSFHVIYAPACLPGPVCHQFHFGVGDGSTTLITLFADPAALPTEVTLMLSGVTKTLSPVPISASGTAQLAATPEPTSAALVALALALLAVRVR
jgi:hypothetical protein